MVQLFEYPQAAPGIAVKPNSCVIPICFLALHSIEREQEPTDEMVQSFCGFMYRHGQRASKAGRQGLGDSMAEMAQYILAQARAPLRSNHARGSGTSEASTSETMLSGG